MRITPIDIRQQQFTLRLFRGFDVQEVDAFLEDLANDYEELVKENALLKEQLAGLEERARGVTDREKMLQETLVTTQRMVEEFKETSRHQAQVVVREAEIQANKILEEARGEEARINNQILVLKRARRQFAEALRSTVEMYQRMIAEELKDAGPAQEEG